MLYNSAARLTHFHILNQEKPHFTSQIIVEYLLGFFHIHVHVHVADITRDTMQREKNSQQFYSAGIFERIALKNSETIVGHDSKRMQHKATL